MRSRRERSPIPTRAGWWATTGCVRRNWRPIRASQPRSATTVAAIKAFAQDVHAGGIKPERADRFTRVALDRDRRLGAGAEFVADALGNPATDKMEPHFVDNTDPDGIARELLAWTDGLDETLVVVMSKSGTTPETRNGMLVVADAYRRHGLDFGRHAVAVTGVQARSSTSRPRRRDGWPVPDVGLGRRPDQ